MAILLSAPHAGCFFHPERRDCDLLAEKAANYLHFLIPESELHVGYSDRAALDLNRDQSLDDPFRIDLRQAADQLKPVISLDIHSFPSSEFGNADIAILDEHPGTDYTRNLYEFLHSQLDLYQIAYFSGSGNSIMIEMRAKGIPSILIEFNEDLPEDKLTTINFAIVEWLIQQGYLF